MAGGLAKENIGMAGHTNFRDVSAARGNPEREARVAQIKAAMEDAIALAAVRQSRGVTQNAVAAILGTTQGNVSQMERRTDLYLSSVRDYIEALGGSLEVSAVFPDGERFELDGRVQAAAN
jgi:DNA-binding transcriptional regulator YiaG